MSSSSSSDSNFTVSFYTPNTSASPIPSYENLIITFLINNHGKIISHLPIGLHDLFRIIIQLDNGDLNIDEFDSSCLKLASYLPMSFVITTLCSQNTTYSSKFQLTFYNLEVLQSWLSYINDDNVDSVDQLPNYYFSTEPNHYLRYADNSNLYQTLFSIISNDDSFLSRTKKTIESLIFEPTSKESLLREHVLSGTIEKPFFEICPRNGCIKHGRLDCLRKIHFEPIITNSTDINMGDCSYLDTCFKGKGCKYVHYKISSPDHKQPNEMKNLTVEHPLLDIPKHSFSNTKMDAQWICCDIRKLDLQVLGEFSVIIADPPWDIHMNGNLQVPTGIITDEEILSFNINEIQSEGIFFLWVTGRALDIGRQCLTKWGYTHIEEIIWCKTNQLARTICTGRTGHWLNHTKEHVLMGIKGNPIWLTKGVDADVIVSTTRDKSHKPDELYDIADRLAGTTSRKLELFGRQHNIRPGWLTIGNQLNGVSLVESELAQNYARWQRSQTLGV